MPNPDVSAAGVANSAPSRFTFLKLVITGLILLALTACVAESDGPGNVSDLELLAYRFSADSNASLNADPGWATAENTSPSLFHDEPFRLRAQIRARQTSSFGHIIALQYRREEQPWQSPGFADFPCPRLATPVVSAVSALAYAHGDETGRLPGDRQVVWDDGHGLNGIASTPVWRAGSDALEWEWPLVIRRFSDGPEFSEDGEQFQLRFVHAGEAGSSGQSTAGIPATG